MPRRGSSGRPVKWVEDRTENLLAAGHARDDVLDVALAVDDDGTILGARVEMTVNQGAYQPTTVPPSIYLDLVRVLFPNAYRIEHFAFEGTVVASNTGPTSRSAGRGSRRAGPASA